MIVRRIVTGRMSLDFGSKDGVERVLITSLGTDSRLDLDAEEFMDLARLLTSIEKASENW